MVASLMANIDITQLETNEESKKQVPEAEQMLN